MLNTLQKKGFEVPSPIQQKIIPLLLHEKKDIIGQAQTGTGKTAAFGIPLIETLTHHDRNTQVLVLVPTRELAIQVADELNSLKGSSNLIIFPIYGGQSIDNQIRNLRRTVDIVVGTPGRTLDLINRKKLLLQDISCFILDEADEMLNMGFIEDIEEIMRSTNPAKRILLFSATMPDVIKKIAQKYMRDSVHISSSASQLTTGLTEQIYFEVHPGDKFEALCRIIDSETQFYSIVFCRTKIDVDAIASKLGDRGYSSEALHGDISQPNREKILRQFRSRKISILVATDVAARGIDISDLTHVINYSLPQDPESYIHRIGRTGRAGKKGTAITFITSSEYRQLSYIKQKANIDIQRKKIPDIKAVIAVKKAKIKHDLYQIIATNEHQEYSELANELSSEHDPKQIIAALIEVMYKDDLKESRYTEIHQEASVDKAGKARLFVAYGKIDRMTPQKLVTLLANEGGIHAHQIQDVQVYEKFSFITVPFHEAEKVIDAFKKGDRDRRRPLISRARPASSRG